MKQIKYFDHAATTAVDEKVLKSMLPYYNKEYGNPSAVYGLAQNARKGIEEAREKIANIIGAKKGEIYFTSGGSESDNLAIKGIAYANKHKGNHIITSKIEHKAVLETCNILEKEGFEVTYLNVDEKGFINLEELKKSIKPNTILISIMFANNEVGTIQPIKEIGEIAKQKGIYFHTDCVQAMGNCLINVNKLNIDALSMSGHKVYGPKGIGVLYVRDGVEFKKIQNGGRQEKDKRAGTENVPGIIGMGVALELAYNHFESNTKHLKELKNYYLNKIVKKIPSAKLNGDKTQSLPGTCNISFMGINGGELLEKLDKYGICASAGSACSAGCSAPSHVLIAMGLPNQLAQSSLRITFGRENTIQDVDYLVECLEKIVKP